MHLPYAEACEDVRREILSIKFLEDVPASYIGLQILQIFRLALREAALRLLEYSSWARKS